jgi:hypothetical protein
VSLPQVGRAKQIHPDQSGLRRNAGGGMTTDAVMIVMFRRALAVMVRITWGTLIVLHMAFSSGMKFRRYFTRILCKRPSIQP